MPALDEDASNVFSKSERLLLDHATKRFKSPSELKELIQTVLHHPDFDLDSVDHDLHERLMKAVEEGDIEIIDMWEEGDGDQDVTFVKRNSAWDSACSQCFCFHEPGFISGSLCHHVSTLLKNSKNEEIVFPVNDDRDRRWARRLEFFM